jgi:hypothetical protein
MEEIDGGSLYGLTCVFPWAVDLSIKHPNCAMTDTTFKAVKPYTLAILHLIFANESIPIGFAISPSETAESYARLYRHVLDQLTARATLIELAPQTLASMPVRPPDPPGEQAEWFTEITTEEEDLDESPGDVGSTHPVDPDLHEEEEDWGEDTLPSNIPAAVSDHSSPYDSLKARTAMYLWRFWDLLLGIPIVTDQGTALKKFIDGFGLSWKLCHRHILESIGAATRIGRWAARILRCFSFGEYRRTRAIIKHEMALSNLIFDQTDHAYKSLRRLLGDLKDDGPLCDMRHWALWLRLGCPRTTNSAESVNGHLNAEVLANQRFVDRVLSVSRHFMQRYYSRDKWRDRALRRNRARCFPPDATNPCHSKGEVLFFQQLHDTVGKSFEKRILETFPGEDRTYFFPAESAVIQAAEGVRLPQNWVEIGAIKKARLQGTCDGDSPPAFLPVHQRSAHTLLSRTAWQIACDFRKHLRPVQWTKHSQEINFGIAQIAKTLAIPQDRIPYKKEAEWRSSCWTNLPGWMSKKMRHTKPSP